MVGFIVGFIAGFVIGFTVDFMVDFVGFKVEDYPLFLYWRLEYRHKYKVTLKH